MLSKFSFQKFFKKKVLILGNVGSGKTKLTTKLLNEATRLGYANDITVIDIAPTTVEVKGKKIGGKMIELTDVIKEVRYLAPSRIETPRLSAKSAGELLRLVNLNKVRIESIIYEYLANPTPILFVNDVSMYFQSGEAELVLLCVKNAETFVANGYYGEYFAFDYETGVSKVEMDLMDLLAKSMDIVIRL